MFHNFASQYQVKMTPPNLSGFKQALSAHLRHQVRFCPADSLFEVRQLFNQVCRYLYMPPSTQLSGISCGRERHHNARVGIDFAIKDHHQSIFYHFRFQAEIVKAGGIRC
ncbi:hypothetical protein MD26_11600 [Pseudomonas sp. H2]|nr:hypothetical protein PC358_25765 [Pseudomonas capeferrum]KGI93067.1 hypothetical protein MD26_11600 [Pseudomonas sp. H2]